MTYVRAFSYRFIVFTAEDMNTIFIVYLFVVILWLCA